MKKQIFILVFVLFVLGITNSYGQLVPRAISATCLPNDALHPIPGSPYNYIVVVPDPVGGTAWDTKKYTWFVTQQTDFLRIDAATKLPVLKYTTSALDLAESATTSLLMTPTTATDYATPGNTSATIELTWKSFAYDPAKPVFVVINVSGSATTGCSDISNLKVFEIVPQFAFTLDIENLTKGGALPSPLTYGANIDNCISAIQGAKFDVTAGVRSIEYDFGADTLYYEVNAANWFDRWELSAKIGGLNANQAAQLDWAYAPTTRPIVYKTDLPAASWKVIVASAANGTAYASPTLVAPKTSGAKAVDQNGESIIIRMIVDHGSKYEGITDEPLTLAVDGLLYHESSTVPGTYDVKGSAKEGDIHTTAGADAVTEKCPWYDGFVNDIATQTIKARPNVTSNTPATVPAVGTAPFLLIK